MSLEEYQQQSFVFQELVSQMLKSPWNINLRNKTILLGTKLKKFEDNYTEEELDFLLENIINNSPN